MNRYLCGAQACDANANDANKASGEKNGAAASAIDLLIEVDFKWLMAGQGCWVDTARLRTDSLYAGNCLRTALCSPCEALRSCAYCLQMSLSPQPFQLALSAPKRSDGIRR